MYPIVFLMMIAMHVSLGGQPLAIRYRHDRHTRSNLCLRGYDNIHIPESPRGDRGNGQETRPGAKPLNRGDVAPNLLALRGTLALQGGEEVSREYG